PQPEAGPASGLGVLFNPGNPAAALDSDELNSVAYWITTAVMLAGLVASGVWAWVRLRRHSRKVETDPRRLVGTATNHDVAQTASPKALLRRAGTLRPSLNDPDPGDVGYRIGTSKGREVWASVEDSILLIGPPRSGKGLHIVIPAGLGAPGAVVTTSTRPDHLTARSAPPGRDARSPPHRPRPRGGRRPDRHLPGPCGVGVRGGLDPAHRPTPLRQGPAHRDPGDPRCTRRRRHHQHPPGQP